MKKQSNSPVAAATAFERDTSSLFSEFGFSATFFDSMPTEILIVGEKGGIVAANEQFRKNFGDQLGVFFQTLLSDDNAEVEVHLRSALATGSSVFDVVYKSSSSAGGEYSIEAFRLDDSENRIALIHKSRPHAHIGFWLRGEKSQANEETAPTAFDQYDSIEMATIAANGENRIVFANKAAFDLLGIEQSGLGELTLDELLLDSTSQKTDFFTGEHNLKRKTGDPLIADVIEVSSSGSTRIFALKDVTARKAEETTLRSAHEFYSLFADQSEYEIARFDLDEPIPIQSPAELQAAEIVRQAHLALHSISKLDNQNLSDCCDAGLSFGGFYNSPETAREIANVFVNSGYRLLRKELVEASPDGKELYFHTNLLGIVEEGRLVRLWLSRRDITLRKQAEKAYLVAEDQLRQSQKIEPIGRLAGGIAHDFNNFLAVIMLQIEMMRQEIGETSPLNKRISEITTVTDKAANMVKQLLAFGRKQTMRPQDVILNDVIEEFIKMTSSLIGEDIEIQVELDPALGVCFVDPNQITQILMNLAVNSKDAMPNGGVLRITTANLSIDANTFKHRAQPKGNYIELKVEDTGVGMDPSTRKHVFEPFFTTKEAHKGTGLGLATVYGIVKQSKGFIWVDSKVDEGTKFRVQFPRTDRVAKAVKQATVGAIPRGHETILVVEDEDLIRKTAVEVLESLGYKILEARNGEEAIHLASEFEGKIHLLLTDVVMPRINGRQLAREIRSSNMGLSVLFMSGYADDIITRHGILEDDVHFLGKPFSPLTLAQRVREAIGGEG